MRLRCVLKHTLFFVATLVCQVEVYVAGTMSEEVLPISENLSYEENLKATLASLREPNSNLLKTLYDSISLQVEHASRFGIKNNLEGLLNNLIDALDAEDEAEKYGTITRSSLTALRELDTALDTIRPQLRAVRGQNIK